MRKYLLNENYPPPQQFVVRFSSKINNDIRTIREYNQENRNALDKWKEYLRGIKAYLSDHVIAWDDMNRYYKFRGGYRRFISDFGYNIGYAVVIDDYTNLPFVFIFMLNLKVGEYGLQIPPSLQGKIKENKRYKMKQKIRLTEGDLHRIIRNCVNEALDEIDSAYLEETIDEGFGNWVKAGINGFTDMRNYSQGPSNSKLVNWTDNVARNKRYYDNRDEVQKARQGGYENAPKVRMANALVQGYCRPGSSVSRARRDSAMNDYHQAKKDQEKIERYRRNRELEEYMQSKNPYYNYRRK